MKIEKLPKDDLLYIPKFLRRKPPTREEAEAAFRRATAGFGVIKIRRLEMPSPDQNFGKIEAMQVNGGTLRVRLHDGHRPRIIGEGSYRGHTAGSRTAHVRRVFDEEGVDAMRKVARDLGLTDNTIRGLLSRFGYSERAIKRAAKERAKLLAPPKKARKAKAPKSAKRVKLRKGTTT